MLSALILAVSLAQSITTEPLGPQADATWRPNTAFRVQFNHDGVNTESYALYFWPSSMPYETLQDILQVSALTNGTVTFSVPNGLPIGTYTVRIYAYGPGGMSQASIVLAVTTSILQLPSKPTNTRIRIIT